VATTLSTQDLVELGRQHHEEIRALLRWSG
jgi:hypothetical protein